MSTRTNAQQFDYIQSLTIGAQPLTSVSKPIRTCSVHHKSPALMRPRDINHQQTDLIFYQFFESLLKVKMALSYVLVNDERWETSTSHS